MLQRTSCAALVAGVSLGAAAIVAATPATASTADRLVAGQGLNAGQSLVAGNGYRFSMQADGNAVVYAPNNAVLFATRTSGHGARLVMQTDGNLVIYSTAGRPLWFNKAHGSGATLVMQGDGNLVEYVAGKPVWASKNPTPPPPPPAAGDTLRPGSRLNAGQQLVSANRAYRFTQQGDGNGVLYGPSGARWSSGTGGHSGSFFTLQGDGNMVIYGPGALWQSGTRGGARLVMQGDGNLVLYSVTNAVLWVRPVPAPPPPPTSQPPAGPPPSSSVNCSDFPTHAAAQAWFNFYYPRYGDIAGLDADHDGQACESLP